MMGTLTAQADNTTYPYLIVETTAGTTTAIDVSSAAVPLTFSGTTLKVGDKTRASARSLLLTWTR